MPPPSPAPPPPHPSPAPPSELQYISDQTLNYAGATAYCISVGGRLAAPTAQVQGFYGLYIQSGEVWIMDSGSSEDSENEDSEEEESEESEENEESDENEENGENGENGGNEEDEENEAVSYTHLTLPTNREV